MVALVALTALVMSCNKETEPVEWYSSGEEFIYEANIPAIFSDKASRVVNCTIRYRIAKQACTASRLVSHYKSREQFDEGVAKPHIEKSVQNAAMLFKAEELQTKCKDFTSLVVDQIFKGPYISGFDGLLQDGSGKYVPSVNMMKENGVEITNVTAIVKPRC